MLQICIIFRGCYSKSLSRDGLGIKKYLIGQIRFFIITKNELEHPVKTCLEKLQTSFVFKIKFVDMSGVKQKSNPP